MACSVWDSIIALGWLQRFSEQCFTCLYESSNCTTWRFGRRIIKSSSKFLRWKHLWIYGSHTILNMRKRGHLLCMSILLPSFHHGQLFIPRIVQDRLIFMLQDFIIELTTVQPSGFRIQVLFVLGSLGSLLSRPSQSTSTVTFLSANLLVDGCFVCHIFLSQVQMSFRQLDLSCTL